MVFLNLDIFFSRADGWGCRRKANSVQLNLPTMTELGNIKKYKNQTQQAVFRISAALLQDLVDYLGPLHAIIATGIDDNVLNV